MIDEDAARPQPLGPRRADEVLIEDLEHIGARIAAPLRDQHEREHGDRQDEMPQRIEEAAAVGAVIPARRQPAQSLRENEDREQAEPEGRQRQRHHRRDRRGMVEKRTTLHRRQDSDRHSDEKRQAERRSHQLESRGQPVEHDVAHRLAAEEAIAPIAGEDAGGPFEILHPDRLIEPELNLDALNVLRGHRRVQRIHRERPARGEVHQREADDRNAHKQDRRLGQAVDQEAAHADGSGGRPVRRVPEFEVR